MSVVRMDSRMLLNVLMHMVTFVLFSKGSVGSLLNSDETWAADSFYTAASMS